MVRAFFAGMLAPGPHPAYHAAMVRLAMPCLLIWSLSIGCIEGQPARTVPETSIPLDDVEDADEVGDAVTCNEPGVTRCAEGANATEICLDGVWQRAACAEDKICVLAGGAQCIDSTGDADCRDTLYCFLGCQVLHPDDEVAADACFVTCYTSATQPAQLELSDALGCFEGNCADQGFECIAERCSQDLADCYYDTKGAAGCARIIECRLACADGDTPCEKACGSDSTIEAQGKYAVLELCTFYQCIGQDAECPRRVTLPTGPCGTYAKDCVDFLPNIAR